MNIEVYIIECIIMCIIFGVFVFGMLFMNPVSFISDYPPEIQARYFETQEKEYKKEKLTAVMMVKKIIALIVFVFVFAWMAHIAGADNFVSALSMTYGYMVIIVAFDTFFLDWVLFANIKKIRLPGTEDMEKEYHQKWFHVKACFPMIPVFVVGGLLIAGIMVWIW
ncbi:MAG: hypothetical protein Q4B09_09830 [Lachnospiraceae bacterium]|nr:hypothetical protein [Lachnospiraceae bacterium]